MRTKDILPHHLAVRNDWFAGDSFSPNDEQGGACGAIRGTRLPPIVRSLMAAPPESNVAVVLSLPQRDRCFRVALADACTRFSDTEDALRFEETARVAWFGSGARFRCRDRVAIVRFITGMIEEDRS